jgi:N-acetylmuramoyl-L-alanine amidase
MRAVFKSAALAAVGCLLWGCASGPPIDRTHTAASQGSRVQFLILHFTWEDWPTSLDILTRGAVSSHYLVRDEPARIYRLVDESRRAFHAGTSSWRGHGSLNSASIGIEIVNGGNRQTEEGVVWQPYPEAQIDAVIELVRAIVTRHGIPPQNVLGHSDVAPLRKVDPGPLFPWQRLAEAGLVVWPDGALVAERLPAFAASLPDAVWFQEKLADHGYGIDRTGEFDEATHKVLAVFQMKYRPERHDGIADAETAAILDVLTTPSSH